MSRLRASRLPARCAEREATPMPHCGSGDTFQQMGHTGLVLTGGGARAAYQVGALRALADIVRPGQMPFDILAGISAGAINAVALSTGADDFQGAARRLTATWSALTPDRIFR